jgi:hypothetical protein
MPGFLATIITLATVLLAAPRDVRACQCTEAAGPPCQSFSTSQAVFIGTVRMITAVNDPQNPTANRRVEFDNVVAIRGVEGLTQTVLTSGGEIMCGYPFEQGERYVVYASRVKRGAPMQTGSCSRTRRLGEASQDLAFFKSFETTTASPRVFGTITHREPGTIRRDGQEYGPVGQVRLMLRNEKATLYAQTDAHGRYEFTGMPPDTYQLTIEPPLEFASDQPVKHTIDLADSHSCAEKNFTVRFDGRVRGFVRNSTGAAASGVTVQLMLVEYLGRTDLVETIDTTTGAAGGFEFERVTPGRYVLGVELFRQAELLPDPSLAFPVTYHPGTQDASRATIIDMRGGERYDLVPMTLPPALRTYELTGIVRFRDGTPAAGASVSLENSVRKWRDIEPSVDTDELGRFSFVVHDGTSYIISAFYRPPNTRGFRPRPTTVGPFLVTRTPDPIAITLSVVP